MMANICKIFEGKKPSNGQKVQMSYIFMTEKGDFSLDEKFF